MICDKDLSKVADLVAGAAMDKCCEIGSKL